MTYSTPEIAAWARVRRIGKRSWMGRTRLTEAAERELYLYLI